MSHPPGGARRNRASPVHPEPQPGSHVLAAFSLLLSLAPAGHAEPGPPRAPVDYVAVALADHPELRAATAVSEAAMHGADRSRRLPEPVVGVGAYVRPVETRVGPQQARVSLEQTVPWPTGLAARGDAAAAQAQAAAIGVDAVALGVTHGVLEAYWSLWEVRATRATHAAHLDVLDGLSRTLRARVEVGACTLADLQQVDLSRARLADRLASMDATEAGAAAALRAAAGLHADAPTWTDGPPPMPEVPAVPDAVLVDRAVDHPELRAAGAEVAAAEALSRATRTQRMPGFTVGADWILTGPAEMPDVADSGKDAVVARVGLRLPLWQRGYAADIAAADATAAARRAGAEARADRATAQARALAAQVRDTARRVGLIEGTLLPQADAAYASLLGAYTAGQAGVAQILLAQQAVLDLRVDLDRAHAAHARAWAALDARCGGALPRVPPPEANR